ncbi:MAG: response regulator transcription factor [Bdellovibrionales bacterium]|nr:response regulator transcription factor [Bdellovibrionales bacterium]
MKILLAEDDPNIVMIAKMVLSKVGGHDVDVAVDGGEALHKALANAYDLILLDGMMPVHPGVEVCKRYQEQKQGPQAPIIFLSAKSSPEDISTFMSLGAGYIQKPFDPKSLCSCIDDILRQAA